MHVLCTAPLLVLLMWPGAHAAQAQPAPADASTPVRGFDALYGKPGVIVTPHEERVRLAAAQSAELSRTLETVPGVVSARVHLAVPDPARLQLDEPVATPRASVLLRHDTTRSIDVEAIRGLISGAVAGLPREQVHVVVAEQESPRVAPPALIELGPITVTRASAPTLKLLLGGLLTTNLLMAAVAAALVARSRR